MGNLTSNFVNDIEKRQRNAALEVQIMQIRQQKKERDNLIASRIATTRERVWWLASFYGALGTVSFTRMIILRRIAPIPIDLLPFVAVPFIFAYQFDLAYLNKANRIKKITDDILNDSSYWFNEPIELSSQEMREIYYRVYNRHNEKRKELGLEEERHWCK